MECHANKFYVKQNELISLIRQSERERVNLEMQLCELDTPKSKHVKNKAALIKSRLKNLYEEERSSKKRNAKIMRRLNNMELSLEDLLSCSDKLKQLKVDCRKIIARDYPNWKQYANELEKQVMLFCHGRNPELNQNQPTDVAATEGFPRQRDNKLESKSYFGQYQPNVVVTSEKFQGQANNRYDPEVVPVKQNYDGDHLLMQCNEYHLQNPNSVVTPNGFEQGVKEQDAAQTDRPPIISKVKAPELLKSVSFKMMPEVKSTSAFEKKTDFASLQMLHHKDKNDEMSAEGQSSDKRRLKPDLSKLELTGEFDSQNLYGANAKTFTKSQPVSAPENISGNIAGPVSENKHITDAAAEDTEFGINSLPEQLVRCPTATSKSVESISDSFGIANRSSEISDDPSDISDFGTEEGLLTDTNDAELNVKPVDAVASDSSLFGNEWRSQTLSLNGLTVLLDIIEETFHSAKWNKDKYYRTVQTLDRGVQDIIKAANTGNKAEINLDPVAISMLVFQQLSIIIENISAKCLLPDSLFHSTDWLSLTEKDVISSLGNCPPATSLWKRLFLHFQCIVNNNIMTVPELAAVFIPSLLHKDSNYQAQAFNIIVSLLGNATETKPPQQQSETKMKQQEQSVKEVSQHQLSSTDPKSRQHQLPTDIKPQQEESEIDIKALQENADAMYPQDFLSDSSSDSLAPIAKPADTNTNTWRKQEQENFAMKPVYSNSNPYSHEDKNVRHCDDEEQDEKDVGDYLHETKSPKMSSSVNISETPAYKTLLTGLMSSISLDEELADSDGESDDLEKEFGSSLTKPHLSGLVPEAGETHNSAMEESPRNISANAKDNSIDFDFYD
ncbi:uncharacterized protein LOC106876681 isoform X3 [Octopus bimaculoides]|uniref:uncharacterized protein LOC106876681 isoform X3 n=1 Tax=Octopus bimaculoides TaxID=37653 RepID=UPI00071CCC62|nr:uncharacterized protein LOC106876681 isoform X3 [Octopus bimaculoides]|eukprot:XP_014780811.1 PREDICTED: uncharacterized protein LOC106876681 isoform X2 [Octopus bimaculoides]